MNVQLWDKKNKIYINKTGIVHVAIDPTIHSFSLDGTKYDEKRYRLDNIYNEDW